MYRSVNLAEFVRSLTIPDIATIAFSLIVGLICLAGIIFAAIRWKQHRAVSTITIFALLLTAISTVTMPVLRLYMTESRVRKIFDNDPTNYSDNLLELAMFLRGLPSLFEAIEIFLQIIILILLLVAVFLRRAKENPNPIQKQ